MNKIWKTSLIVFVLVFLVQISLVSALNLDNIKGDLIIDETTSKYGKITIKDWFGLLDLATVELKKNSDICGASCSMETEIIMYQEGVLIEDVKFIGYQVKDYQFYIQTGFHETGKIIDIKEKVCSDVKGNLSCEWKVTGAYPETEPVWSKYNVGDEVGIGVWNIKLEGTKDFYSETDWIIKTQGKELTEWADWGAGGTITYDGDYVVHTYLVNGTFEVTTSGNLSVLIVAGGGGGGSENGGAGGAGGLIYNNSYILPIGDYDVAVGVGGQGVTYGSANGKNGSFSSFAGLVAIGGGNGASCSDTGYAPGSGGSGGGGGHCWDTYGLGTANQGNDGGLRASPWSAPNAAGGGGGASEAGDQGVGSDAGDGGDGLAYDINGTSWYYAGGGGGSIATGNAGAGGNGGGGAGAVGAATGTSGTPNSGGGGGGSGTGNGGNGGTGIVIIRYDRDNNISTSSIVTTTLNSPIDYFNSTINLVTFNCSGETTAFGGAVMANISLWLNQTGTWILNETAIASGTEFFYEFTKNISDGNMMGWTCQAYDDSNSYSWGTNKTFTVDTLHPALKINQPTGTKSYGYEGKAETLNWTASDDGFGSVWYNYNGTNYTLVGAINTTTFYLKNSSYNLTMWANDTTGNVNSSYVEWEYKIFNNGETYNNKSYETASETFTINVTANSSLTAANLIYGSTSYDGTKSGTVWSKTLDIPLGSVNKNFYWNFTYGGEEISSNSNTQTVNDTHLVLCNATYPVPYVNFTFKDESTLLKMNASVDSATFDYWLGDGTIYETYIFQNTTHNLNYAFCFAPADKPITIDLSFKYSDTSYPLRTFVYDAKALTNSTTDKGLYLLFDDDGIYSSISTVSLTGAPISGVLVQIEREISGTWTLISQGTTDSSGLVTFWVNPDFIHRVTTSKTGYTSVQVSITPTQSLYTITLSTGAGTSQFNSSIEGLRWETYPGSGTLEPQINQAFNATVWATEGLVALENCKFELLNASNISQVLASSISITNSTYCQMSITYTTSANVNLFGRLSVDTDRSDGFVVVDTDWKWILIDIDRKAWRGIPAFFSELKDLSEWGEGNEAEFSRIIWFFLITTILIGVFTFFSGVEFTSPGGSIILIWVLIILASSAGFLTFNSGADNLLGHFEQYGFMWIATMYVIGFMLNKLRASMD